MNFGDRTERSLLVLSWRKQMCYLFAVIYWKLSEVSDFLLVITQHCTKYSQIYVDVNKIRKDHRRIKLKNYQRQKTISSIWTKIKISTPWGKSCDMGCDFLLSQVTKLPFWRPQINCLPLECQQVLEISCHEKNEA